MVFSFLLHVCQPPPVCCFHSQGRDLFTTLAVSVFPLCLILEKQIWGWLAQNILSAVCIALRKQKVFNSTVLLQVSSIFITFASVLVFLFVLKCISFIADRYSHAIWFSVIFCKLKMKLYAIVL